MKMQNGSSHIYFTKTTPESGSHILVLQPECDIIMSAKEKQATTVMHQRCMMRPQPIAAGNYAWDEVPVEKIISSEAAALRSSGIFEYERGRNPRTKRT